MSFLKKLFHRRGSSSKHSDKAHKNNSDKIEQVNSTANQIVTANTDEVKEIDKDTDLSTILLKSKSFYAVIEYILEFVRVLISYQL